MTEQLSSLLHDRASGMDFDPVDLDLLTSTGDRRIRRRRFAGVAGGVVAVVAVSGVVVAVGGPGDDQARPDPVDVPRLAAEPSYALGSTIHTPSGDVEVGHRVVSYVRTRVGYVTADPQGRIWSVVAGEVEMVGETDARDADLVGDVGSSKVGWVDPKCSRKEFRCTVPKSPILAVFDQETGLVQALDVDTSGMGILDDEDDPASFYALSDGVAYVRTHDGAVAIDLESGGQTVVDPGARNGFDIYAAHEGTVAFATEDFGGIALGPTRAEATTVVESSSTDDVRFAPDGAHLLIGADETRVLVVDVATGEQVDFFTPWDGDGPSTSPLTKDYVATVEWLDAGTVVAFAIDDGSASESNASFELLTCDVGSGDCDLAGACDVPSETCTPASFVLPNLEASDGGGLVLPTGSDYR